MLIMEKYINDRKIYTSMDKVFVHLHNAKELINKAKRRYLQDHKSATSVGTQTVVLDALTEYVK